MTGVASAAAWSGLAVPRAVADVAVPVAVLHVDAGAPVGGDGSSPARAFRDLQPALDAASLFAGQAVEIRIAAGVYRPSKRTIASDPRSAAFSVPANTRLIGGQPTLRPREVAGLWSPVTTLSGDLNGNDAQGGLLDNAYRVVIAGGSGVVLEDLTISGGNASAPAFPNSAGAGVFADGRGVTLRRCTIENNRASLLGGGAFLRSGAFLLEDCVVRGNLATTSGGGLYIAQAAPVLRRCTVEDNRTTSQDGGGVMFYLCTPSTTEDSVFAFNTAGDDGGGVYTFGGEARITGSVFEGNLAGEDGGGVWFQQGNGTVNRCRFLSNRAPDQGGAIGTWQGTALYINSEFSGNWAGNDGGVAYFFEGNHRIVHCTMVSNASDDDAGGVFTSAVATLQIANSVLWGNQDASGLGEFAQVRVTGSNISTRHCCIAGWTGLSVPGTGNITSSPMLVNVAGADGVVGTIDDDLSLRADSPCVDASDNFATPLGYTIDAGGSPRFVNAPDATDTGVGLGAVGDIGARERAALRADVTGDGRLTAADVATFELVFAQADPAADVNADGVLSPEDLTAFLELLLSPRER